MHWHRARSILLGTFFSLIAYPTLAFLLWLNNQSVGYQGILGDGGLYFFATAATAPVFIETLLAQRHPTGILAFPFFAIPIIIIMLTMLVYANSVAAKLGDTPITPVTAERAVHVALACAVCALGYRYGFDPQRHTARVVVQ